jgi:putative tryptophan/tyrosine transport system substrate-binding protein
MPRASRIGLLLHSSNSSQQNSLIESAENAGFELIIGTVESNDDIGASLSHLLGNIDVLLALPDSRIHNSNTISNILTTSYRNHIPVIGFSSAYVKAGAMAAVYTSLEDISQQVSDVAIQLLRKKHLDTHTILAKYFSISFNFDVARSLGIALRSPSEIKETMLRGDSE